MATVTPNFNWPVPTSTDLVKDGATAIEALGDSIDASLVDLKGGTSGQVLSKNSNTDMDFVWVTSDDANAIQNTIVDAKGDLITATAADTPARLAVGSNGETLVADSSTSTGLRYTAGTVQANPVLNSAMQVWQRGTSVAGVNGVNTYTSDRWALYQAGASTQITVSRQLTNDTTNLPNIQYCARVQRNSGSTYTNAKYLFQSFETINSIPFAGKTVTLSYYARKGADFTDGSPAFNVSIQTGTGTDQNWLTGYTGNAVAVTSTPTLTTTWQRFTATSTIAATATELAVIVDNRGTGTAGANDWYEITGVQIDIGSVALPFRTYAATLQGELAACSRYFQVSQFGVGKANGTTTALVQVVWNNMRIAPSYSIPSLNSILLEIGVAYRTPTSSSLNSITANVSNGCSEIYFQGASGMTTGNLVNIGGDSIQFSAEL
jgi:hypothetical protein